MQTPTSETSGHACTPRTQTSPSFINNVSPETSTTMSTHPSNAYPVSWQMYTSKATNNKPRSPTYPRDAECVHSPSKRVLLIGIESRSQRRGSERTIENKHSDVRECRVRITHRSAVKRRETATAVTTAVAVVVLVLVVRFRALRVLIVFVDGVAVAFTPLRFFFCQNAKHRHEVHGVSCARPQLAVPIDSTLARRRVCPCVRHGSPGWFVAKQTAEERRDADGAPHVRRHHHGNDASWNRKQKNKIEVV